jgi:glycosyltransferase involved in cell wall biosynthesis
MVKRSRRVAYVYERPDTSTFRYRVFNMVQALDAAPDLDISAAWFTRDDICRDISFVDRADAVVICRTRYDDSVARVIARAHSRGTAVIYDVDDLIFNPDYVHLVIDTLDVKLRSEEDWNYWFSYISRLGATLRCCDAAIGTNAFLADRITEYAPHLPVSVIPNFLNRQQTEVSRTLVARKRTTGFQRDGHVDLGYFSGSPTHNRDLLVASPALAAVFERFPQVRLRVVGFIELNSYLEPYRDRIEAHPLQDYLNLQRATADVELSIVPLQHNDFTNCKSDLKYFEAAVVGVPTMASPSFTFVRTITDGSNGFLASSDEWLEKMSNVVALIDDDRSAYEAMAERVVADAEKRYAWNGQAKVIEAALFGSPPTLSSAAATFTPGHP